MSTTKSPQKRFHEILKSFDSAMLVSQDHSGSLHARPMMVADIEADNDVWFVTSIDSGKVDEISSHPTVNISFQGGGNYLSMSGQAQVLYDQGKVTELWNDMWKVWFPDGPNDPNIALIKVNASHGEFWDNSGMNRFKYLFEAGKAYLSGTTPEMDEDANQKVNLS